MKLLVAFSLLSLIILVSPSASAVSVPPAPTNLEAIAVTEDSITLAWGPAQPGEFSFVSATGNSVTIRWGASQDVRSSITYMLTKNNTTVATGLTGTTYKLGGINNKVTSFRTCVRAINQAGQQSPPMCATWTKG